MDAREAILLASIFFAFGGVANGIVAAEPAIPNYQRVADWPALPAFLKLGPVSGVATDSAGRVYLLQRAQPPVVVFDGNGTLLRTWGDGLFKTPHGLRIDADDNVWITDIGSHIVMKCDAGGKTLLTLGRRNEPGDGPDRFNKPTDVALSAAGDIFVTDGYGNARVVKFSKAGRFLAEWGKEGTGPGEFDLPHSICTDGKERIYVGDRENDRVQVFNLDGKYLAEFKESGAPYGLFLNRDRLFVADGRAQTINVLSLSGKRIGEWSTGEGDSNAPHWVWLDPQGAVYVAYVGGRRIEKFIAK
jgi:DNA-binding beta-propeller fold protein YncE